jgi:hypothetical protein
MGCWEGTRGAGDAGLGAEDAGLGAGGEFSVGGPPKISGLQTLKNGHSEPKESCLDMGRAPQASA